MVWSLSSCVCLLSTWLRRTRMLAYLLFQFQYSMPNCPRCLRYLLMSQAVTSHLLQPCSACHDDNYWYQLKVPTPSLAHKNVPSPPHPASSFFDFPLDQDQKSGQHLDFQSGFAAGAHEDTHMEEDVASIPGIQNHDWVVDHYVGASVIYGVGKTFLMQFDKDQYSACCLTNLYYPFTDSNDWGLVNFLLKSGLSMHTINEHLSLDIICRLCFIWTPTDRF